MEYAQLTASGEAIQVTTHGNVEWDATHYCPASALTPDEATLFRVVPLTVVDQPAFDPLTQSVTRDGCELVEGEWRYKWRIDALSEATITANLASAKVAAWERIKAERDRRKFAGVKVGSDWFHCDTDSRGQWERMVNKVNAKGLADSAGYTIGGQPVPWKTMTGSFVILTAGTIRAVVDAVELQEAVIFGTAEAHRVAMEASATPETYDFSSGWPASIED